MPPNTELEKNIEHNSKLLEENNQILKKIHRNAVWGFWLRVAWYLILIGLPFVVYFYIIEPYFEFFGANYETFRAGIGEIPGLKGFEQVMGGHE